MNDWINLKDYTLTALLLNGAGCLFWLLAYAVLVTRILKNRFVEMPVLVAGANFGWEIVWSVWFHPDTGRLFSLMYAGAAALDIFIFASVLRYGMRQLDSHPRLRPSTFKALCCFNVLFWAAVCYSGRAEGLDDVLGARSGYVINVILSYTSLTLAQRLGTRASFSLALGLFRLLGTGLISLSLLLIYPQSPWLHLLGAACAVIDAAFVGRLAWLRLSARRQGQRAVGALA